jgi:hypothetical protein
MPKKEDLTFASQMVQSMIEAEVKLERAYLRKDTKEFDKIKKMMTEMQKKISEMIK